VGGAEAVGVARPFDYRFGEGVGDAESSQGGTVGAQVQGFGDGA
jgi:hypothetical protein